MMKCVLLCLALGVSSVLADGPADNIRSNVRPIPPLGVEVPQADREALQKGLDELKELIGEVRKAQAKNPQLADLLPDVEIFHKAVDWALRYQEFQKAEEIKTAYGQLDEGKRRAVALKSGDAPWTRAKGLVVRAYRSKIDGSLQPYGMSIPASYNGARTRMDFWLRGRAEKSGELAFIEDRMKGTGAINPAHVLVLHPFGRFCCANKMAGEVDLFEAYEHARKFYNIDEDRLVVRGFSMGGAAAWQFATHFPSMWCAASPGAGFSETPEFLMLFQQEALTGIPDYQRTLWHLYNASDYALNLSHCPTVAYSGEIDKQKQAADVMAREMKKENLELLHLIGPQTAHKLHPGSLKEIEARLAAIAAKGRDRAPRTLHFTTWTLRYNKTHWLVVDGLAAHWERARVDAEIQGDAAVALKTQNITALTVDFAAGNCPLDPMKIPVIRIDGAELKAGRVMSDRSWKASLRKVEGVWKLAEAETETKTEFTKKPGLQGPVDDAFWDAFVFVTPSGQAWHEATGNWVGGELKRAVLEWRRQFRGDAPVVKDVELKEEDIQNNHLVLWGDPGSNAVIGKIMEKLPVKWTPQGLEVNGVNYRADGHVPLLIYPNPLNPSRYVVINSGFTYREYDYLNNARQVPKLPDWAVVDLSVPPDAISPGKVVDAGFFDESWAWKMTGKP